MIVGPSPKSSASKSFGKRFTEGLSKCGLNYFNKEETFLNFKIKDFTITLDQFKKLFFPITESDFNKQIKKLFPYIKKDSSFYKWLDQNKANLFSNLYSRSIDSPLPCLGSMIDGVPAEYTSEYILNRINIFHYWVNQVEDNEKTKYNLITFVDSFKDEDNEEFFRYNVRATYQHTENSTPTIVFAENIFVVNSPENFRRPYTQQQTSKRNDAGSLDFIDAAFATQEKALAEFKKIEKAVIAGNENVGIKGMAVYQQKNDTLNDEQEGKQINLPFHIYMGKDGAKQGILGPDYVILEKRKISSQDNFEVFTIVPENAYEEHYGYSEPLCQTKLSNFIEIF